MRSEIGHEHTTHTRRKMKLIGANIGFSTTRDTTAIAFLDGDHFGVERAETPSMEILVADDNVDSADYLARMLKIAGHELHVAYDGPTALAVAKSFQPKVVLLDIGIPGLTGYEVARRLKETPETKNATLVAITGWGQPEDQQRSREAGFDYHLLKSVRPETLQHLLASISKHR
jgi:two-component system OmpR family response regulator